MILKTKKRGLVADRKESVSTHIKEIQRVKSTKSSATSVKIFFKGKQFSGIVELTDSELKQIADTL